MKENKAIPKAMLFIRPILAAANIIPGRKNGRIAARIKGFTRMKAMAYWRPEFPLFFLPRDSWIEVLPGIKYLVKVVKKQ